MAHTIPMNSISLDAAQLVAGVAMAAARQMGCAMQICVADPSGEPVVTLRMDGSPRLSADIARNKAYSVTSFNGMPTHVWWSAIEHDPSLVHGITQTPRLTIFGGGIPIHVDGQLVGAIGVSGGSAEQDQAVAEAGAAALSQTD